LELERRFIERTDFSAARRGYDPEEVDRHLREIADAAEETKSKSSAGESLGSAAAERIQVILEAAENSATEIEAKARAEAAETRRSAEADAQETRTNAENEAAGHVERVQAATGQLTTKAETIDSELESLVRGLRDTVSELTEKLRSEATDLNGQLEELREGLSDIRAAGPAGSATTSVGSSSGSSTITSAVDEDVIEEVEEEEAEVAHEAATEEEPELVIEEEEIQLVEEGDTEVADAGEEDDDVAGAEAAVTGEGSEGARLIALNMALNGTPRDETARYLEENFDLGDQDSILDEVYARAGG
jgi:DivIVA domain-containing protein